MPNHITNIFDVTGPEADVKKFRETVDGNNPVVKKYWADHRKMETDRLKAKLKYNPQDAGAKMDLENLKDEKDDPAILDFNGTVPMPLEVRCTTSGGSPSPEEIAQQKLNEKKYGCTDWYSWSNKYWGTKWGAYDIRDEIETIEGGIRYRFNTAWAPPAQWIVTTAQQFPTLKFVDGWIDEGGGAGRFTVQTENGEVTADDQSLEDHDWKMAFDEKYAEDYANITTGDYDKFIAETLESGTEDIDYDLEKFIVERIQVKDLALFKDLEWQLDFARQVYEERLKVSQIKPEDLALFVSSKWETEPARKDYEDRLKESKSTRKIVLEA